MLLVKLPNPDRIRDRSRERLLACKKLHLVLDLDQTLIHATKVSELPIDERDYLLENAKNIKDMYMIMGGARVVKLRAGVGEFLKAASSMFDVSVYTMGEAIYAKWIVDTINNNNGSKKPIIEKIISREDCTIEKRKGLDVVMSHKQNVLIVDDKEDVWMEDDRPNVIAIKPYYFFGRRNKQNCYDDHELGRVLGVLREVHSRFFGNFEAGLEVEKRDVRQVLQGVRMSWGGLSEAQVTCNDHDMGPKASRCLKVVFKLKLSGDNDSRFCTKTMKNGEEDNKKVKKRGREGNNCGQEMQRHGKECKKWQGNHMICHTLS